MDVLEYRGNHGVVLLNVILVDVPSVYQNLTGGRRVQTANQLDLGGFSGTVHTHESQTFSGGNRKVQSVDDILFRSVVAVVYIL